MSFLQELTEKLTTRTIRPYKASSVKPVYSFIKQLNGGQHPTSLEFLTDTTTVKNRLEKFATSTRRSVVFALRNVLDAYDRKDLLKLYEADIKAVQDGEGPCCGRVAGGGPEPVVVKVLFPDVDGPAMRGPRPQDHALHDVHVIVLRVAIAEFGARASGACCRCCGGRFQAAGAVW